MHTYLEAKQSGQWAVEKVVKAVGDEDLNLIKWQKFDPISCRPGCDEIGGIKYAVKYCEMATTVYAPPYFIAA